MNTAYIDRFDDKIVIPKVMRTSQMDLFGDSLIDLQPAIPHVYYHAPDIDLSVYDKIICCMSGGKDSVAFFLRLLEMGVDKSRLEIWHHLVDGAVTEQQFMDWSFIDSYCEKFAAAYGVPYYRSWLDGGFKREMLKNNEVPQGHSIETPSGLIKLGRPMAKPGTRMRFPQQSASISTRWCSGELKCVPGRRAVTSQPRFEGEDIKILYVTGERREESGPRAKYNQLEPLTGVDTIRQSKSPRKPRYVDWWKGALDMTEEEVWEILCRHKVVAPVPYRLGWSRSSCFGCVFNSDSIWATANKYWPERVQEYAEWEDTFGLSIARSGLNVLERAAKAKALDIDDAEALEQSFKKTYDLPIFVPEGQQWKLPPGAFSAESSGAL